MIAISQPLTCPAFLLPVRRMVANLDASRGREEGRKAGRFAFEAYHMDIFVIRVE